MPVIDCNSYNVFINESWTQLREIIEEKSYSRIGILVDENTKLHCLPKFLAEFHDLTPEIIEIKSGEQEKNLESCKHIWNVMLEAGFDRHSLMINLGGGVIGDMGGFCASTFMRGMDFIQIPTTLLSQVDASVGGKLGVDFQDYKNLIGIIKDPIAVWIDDSFLGTLEARQIRSGYAEIIKHALISDAEMWEEIKGISDLTKISWGPVIERSVKIKRDVVEQDKYEGSLRKILNFGHTLGHAIESENLHQADFLLHGEAIGIGMITEAYISMKMLGLSQVDYMEIKKYILSIYPHYPNHLANEENIVAKMLKDKKNRRGMLNFSLLKQIGECTFDVVPEESTISNSLADYKEL